LGVGSGPLTDKYLDPISDDFDEVLDEFSSS
jgi:hypothetical protein